MGGVRAGYIYIASRGCGECGSVGSVQGCGGCCHVGVSLCATT